MLIAGIMTGTSLDGIDIAAVRFEDNGGVHSFNQIAFKSYPFPNDFRKEASLLIDGKVSLNKISAFHFAFSKVLANYLKLFSAETGLALSDFTAVSMHGQTVWHSPVPESFGEIETASTLQLGSGSALANYINLPVVFDFRSADVALGGQGAPLVPIFDYNFLAKADKNVIALNIGGMANITFIPASASSNEIKAFDTGPGNILVDSFCQKYLNIRFDDEGAIARKGRLIQALSDRLMSIEFINLVPPKSTGRELFNIKLTENFLKELNLTSAPKSDILYTLTDFTANSIASNIEHYASPDSLIIASGGGINNKLLLELLKSKLKSSKIIASDEISLDSKAKEAVAFAYIAYRTILGLPGNLPSVTGAQRETVLGVIAQ